MAGVGVKAVGRIILFVCALLAPVALWPSPAGAESNANVVADNAATLAAGGPGVYAWGYNDFNQRGDGAPEEQAHRTPVGGLPPLRHISAGYHFTVAVDETGHVWSWGDDRFGQLGYPVDSADQQQPDAPPDPRPRPRERCRRHLRLQRCGPAR